MTGATLKKGGNITLTEVSPEISEIHVILGWAPRKLAGMEVDASAFALTADGKVRGDFDLVFYNNPRIPEGAVEALIDSASYGSPDDCQVFALALPRMPAEIEKIAFTVTIYEGQERGQQFGMLKAAWARVVNVDNETELARFELPLSDTPETAMIFCEVYRHRADWKFRAVGQGYVGGLEPLATGYGIEVADGPVEPTSSTLADLATDFPLASAPSPLASSSQSLLSQEVASESVSSSLPAPETPPVPPSLELTSDDYSAVLEARISELGLPDRDFGDLVKKAGSQLKKQGLEGHDAYMALCLDISGSMQGFYNRGAIDVLIRRALALGFLFDKETKLDVFLFGANAHHFGIINVENYLTFAGHMLQQYKLESGTNYGKVMQLVRERCRELPIFGHVPVYVLFVTDGDTSDRKRTEQQIVEASREGIFWQFMGIGESRVEKKSFFSKLLGSSFDFLTELSQMRNRVVDNTHFFLVRDPTEPSEEAFFELLMSVYPFWLKAARAKGVLR